MVTPTGRLLVLLPGLGAVATTFVAGVELARRGLATPFGSLTQLGTARVGNRAVRLSGLVPLADTRDLVFGGWDIVGRDAAEAAAHAGVLSPAHLAAALPFLRELRPRPALHDPRRVRRLAADNVADVRSHRHAIDVLHADIDAMMAASGAARAVLVHTGSVETHAPVPDFGADLRDFERALDRSDPGITPTMLYAYAAIARGIPVANATPNVCVDLPALQQLAERTGAPIAGKDLKTGQTWLKAVLAPAIKARALGLRGWFSTNILGNRDGEVLDDPEAFRSKEATKSLVLDGILRPDLHPELYGDYVHKVTIHYYPPRGDDKEAWDAIDLVGWLGSPLQIRIDLQCRDSALAAPMILDLALLLDLARRAERSGPQSWLSFYFKAPIAERPEHDPSVQHEHLVSTLRALSAEAR